MRNGAIISSGVFHGLAVLLAVTGLPFLARHEFSIPPPIVVDFVEISKVTETDKVAPQPVPPKPEKAEPEEKEKPAPAAQNTMKEAIVPVPREKPKPEEKKEVKKEVKTETADPNAPPDKNTKIKKTEEVKKEPPKDFSSVLKNLAAPKDKPAPKDAGGSAAVKPGQNAPLGAKMTMSEEDALRSQLEKCWNVPYGAKDAENMAVDVFMVINPDRTLREARIVNMPRYYSDNFFRAAADSALRAVRSPLCSPFDVPPDKYDVWNTVTVTFNPKDMF
ncbi:MAG: hypothetical protein V1721_05670 [Pseudomonadota bacterium]